MSYQNIRDELIVRLKSIYNNRDFVVGVLSNAQHPDDRRQIIDYIDAGNEVTIENIILLSVHLDQKRND